MFLKEISAYTTIDPNKCNQYSIDISPRRCATFSELPSNKCTIACTGFVIYFTQVNPYSNNSLCKMEKRQKLKFFYKYLERQIDLDFEPSVQTI